ncbi:MAG: hypothetical protein HOP02_04135 [Methylococcaceae bacterium]|nr:hypothetical protein [Methylococcaceae bacterium]
MKSKNPLSPQKVASEKTAVVSNIVGKLWHVLRELLETVLLRDVFFEKFAMVIDS